MSKLKQKIYQLVKDYPNDMMLGEQVRMLVNDMNNEWRIEQFNRNRAPEDQVSTIEELEGVVNKLFIYESPDGKKVYRRRFGDYDNKELIKD